jgi:hypothetical protein
VTVDNVAEDEIDCQNLRFSRSRLWPAAASAAQDDMIIVVVVVVVKILEWFEFGGGRGRSSSNEIYL